MKRLVKAVNNEQLVQELVDLLEKEGFYYYDVDEILDMVGKNCSLQFVKKAYGDSYEDYVEDVFSPNNLKRIKEIAKQLKIQIPDYVYYD